MLFALSANQQQAENVIFTFLHVLEKAWFPFLTPGGVTPVRAQASEADWGSLRGKQAFTDIDIFFSLQQKSWLV